MRIKSYYLFVILLIGFSITIVAQPVSYGPQNGHSHNDYAGKHPFVLAYKKGFGSIEADVFARSGKLVVAHSEEEIDPDKTLQALYIQPLAKTMAENSERQLQLLIDIKDEYETCLQLLEQELTPIKILLTTPEKPGQIQIVISGLRPPPDEYLNYPGYLYFDYQEYLFHTPEQWKRVALISRSFQKISAWKGKNKLPLQDRNKIQHVIDSAHQAGKPFRFWAAPDTKGSWKMQRMLQADFIGTDRVSKLAAFLKRKQFRRS